ncbi:hypothetical protein Hanom_Chr15g01406041 [Helianthus anomalus]
MKSPNLASFSKHEGLLIGQTNIHSLCGVGTVTSYAVVPTPSPLPHHRPNPPMPPSLSPPPLPPSLPPGYTPLNKALRWWKSLWIQICGAPSLHGIASSHIQKQQLWWW